MNGSVSAGIVVLVAVLLVAGVGGPIAAHSSDAVVSSAVDDRHESTEYQLSDVTTADEFAAASSQEFDSTTFEITVHDNGSATWTFRHERILSGDREEAEFVAFGEEFESEETALYERFTEQAHALTERGATETDREMEAIGFSRNASVEHRPNAMGVVKMSFTWTEFAENDDDGVVVGDVFEGGLYIGSDQTLVVRPDDGLVFDAVDPEGAYVGTSIRSANSVSWSGEYEFLDGQPRIVLEPEAPADGGDSGGVSIANDALASPWLVLVVLVTVLGVGALIWHRSDLPGGRSRDAPSAATGTESPSSTHAPPAGQRSDPITEQELLSDEDRVVQLIRSNGCRMKQVDIVENTGWSKSKVSMLLSEMEDDGTINKLRVGRENIISLEGFEPEAAKSPFEE